MVGFVIEGEWLTEFSRARVIEGRFDHGYRTLYEGLDGISSDQVLDILAGRAKLTGKNDVDMIYEEDAEWQQTLAWHFAGTWVTPSGRFLRPYAIVESWGPDDMKYASNITKDSDSVGRTTNTFGRVTGQYAGSSLFYADDPERDVLKLLKCDGTAGTDRNGRRHILFKEISNYPFQLVPAHHDAQKALDQWLEHHHLRSVGYCVSFPSDMYTHRMQVSAPDVERPALSTPASSDMDLPEVKRFIRERAEAIDIEKFGGTRKEYNEYWDIMNGRAEEFLKKVRDTEALDSFDTKRREYHNRIVQQAGDNWIDIGGIRVPQAPFENWCLWRGDGAHLALPWEPVCPSGLKMMGDDPYHTDFIIGAGLDLDAMADYNSDFSQAVWDMRHTVQEEKLGFKCAVLCGTGRSGPLEVVHPKRGESCLSSQVAVIPNAGPHYVEAAMTAGAVICEQGGAMAHLVTVSREKDVKIVRVEGARKLYPEGMTLEVDCSKGDVRVPYNRVDYKMKLGDMIIDLDKV